MQSDEQFHPKVIWFYGLSSAGKTTLANVLKVHLEKQNTSSVILDGDDIRQGLCCDLAYSIKDRLENVRRVAHVANLFKNVGILDRF